MKKICLLCFAFLLAVSAFAQVGAYNLSTVNIGTNALAANSTNYFPILAQTVIVTNVGTADGIYYLATNSATNVVNFTLPTTNTLAFTNTFIASNTIVGISTRTWTVYEPVNATNNTPYYLTNAAYITYSNSLPVLTNAATITTNYQRFNFTTPVTFSATGTNKTVVTNNFYGASTLDVRYAETAGVLLSFNLTGAGTSAVTLEYQPSVDGSTTNTAPPVAIPLVAAGTATVSTNVSLSVGPFGWLKLTRIINANATAVTNLTVKVSQKSK